MALLGEGHELIAEATHTRPDTHCQCNTQQHTRRQLAVSQPQQQSIGTSSAGLGWAGRGWAAHSATASSGSDCTQ